MPGFRIETNLHERVNDCLFLLLRITHVVNAQPFADDLPDRHPRTQAAVGVLEDHLHLPAQRPHGALRHALQRLTLEADLAATGQQTKDSQPQGRLARAAFADDPQRLPRGRLKFTPSTALM